MSKSDDGIVDRGGGKIDEMAVVDSTVRHLLGELAEVNSASVRHALPRILRQVEEKIVESFSADHDETQEKLPLGIIKNGEPLCSMFPSEWCAPGGCPDVKECLEKIMKKSSLPDMPACAKGGCNGCTCPE